MQIIIRSKKAKVEKTLKDYITKKINRLGKYFKKIKQALVELEVRNQKDISRSQIVQVTIWIKGATLRAVEFASDFFSAMDLVIDKLERQIKKYKEKKIDSSHAKRIEKRPISKPLVNNLEPQANLEIPEIVEIKKISPKPMTIEEALLEAKTLNLNYFAFQNAATSKFNVIYRLKDNRFGLIEPA